MGFITQQPTPDPDSVSSTGDSGGGGGTQGADVSEWVRNLSGLAGAAGSGAAIYFGYKGMRGQQRALEMQRQAQQFAEARAAQQQRESAIAIRRANRKQPDIAAILSAAQGVGGTGIGSTFLSGLGGRKTPLGGGQ